MKKTILLIIILQLCHYIVLAESNLLPETSRPKVGLTLSGGGAKGLIYVGLLKMIDSLDIKIDYITGTSMGSIIGGLYSIGYSGEQLDSLSRNTEWSKYLTNNIPLNKITMEEKDEYGRYMIELNSNTLSPDLPISLINGQNIMVLLNDLTFRVHHISDFNKFPIPFKCIATDIVSGKPVVLDKGSLALALRTSMSIPTAFSPIDTGQMLLVDGGLFKNFPVEYVKQMGADYVIGANTSGTLLSKKELKTMMNMLDQTTSFSIAADFEKEKKLCDLLIDYNHVLKDANISTMDFDKSKEILALGEIVAHQFLEPLVSLANEQKKYIKSNNVSVELNHTDTLSMDDIKLSLDKSELEGIIRNKINLSDYNNISKTEINRAIDEIISTRYYDKVYYYVDNKDEKHTLVLKTEKTKKFTYKLGIHYDTEMSAGIIANLTARNLLFNSSRLVTTIDISDNPKIRVGYQKYLGSKGFYLSSANLFEYVKQSAFYNTKSLGIYKNLYFQSDILINYATTQNSALSGGIQFKWGDLKPSIKPEERPDLYQTLFALTKRPYLNSSIILKYAYNSYERQVFPSKGINLLAQSEFVFAGKTSTGIHTEFSEVDSSFNVSTISFDTTISHNFNPYFKWYAMYEHIFRLHRKVSLDTRLDFGMIFLFQPSDDDFANQESNAFYTGGTEQRERERTSSITPFWGNHELYVQNLNFLTLSVAVQYEAIKNLFIIPKVSIFTGDGGNTAVYGEKGAISNVKNNPLLFAHSEGITIAYKSPVGPIMFNLSKASNSSKLLFYFSLGYRI